MRDWHEKPADGGAWVAQSVEQPTLGLGSGHALSVRDFEPHVTWGLCADSAEPAWDSLSPSLSAPPLLSLFLSQKQKQTNKKPGRRKKKKKQQTQLPNVTENVSWHHSALLLLLLCFLTPFQPCRSENLPDPPAAGQAPRWIPGNGSAVSLGWRRKRRGGGG